MIFEARGPIAAGRKLDRNRHQLSHDARDQLGHDYNARERPFIRARRRGAEAAYEHGRKSAGQEPSRTIHLQPRISIIPAPSHEHSNFSLSQAVRESSHHG